MCTQLAESLRLYTMSGQMRAVWYHIPNEGNRTKLMNTILRGMGLIKGAYDYAFMWQGGGGVIEMKTKRGKHEDAQKDFAIWCEVEGVRHKLCRSVDEAEETLREWGVLKMG